MPLINPIHLIAISVQNKIGAITLTKVHSVVHCKTATFELKYTAWFCIRVVCVYGMLFVARVLGNYSF